MQRLMFSVTGLMIIICVFVFTTGKVSVGADKAEPVKTTQTKATTSKTTRMIASGKVLEVTETTLKIERTVKSKKALSSETMDFVLEKPVSVQPGDKVSISYIKKDDRFVATRVKGVSKKEKTDPKAQEKPSEKNSAPAGIKEK